MITYVRLNVHGAFSRGLWAPHRAPLSVSVRLVLMVDFTACDARLLSNRWHNLTRIGICTGDCEGKNHVHMVTWLGRQSETYRHHQGRLNRCSERRIHTLLLSAQDDPV